MNSLRSKTGKALAWDLFGNYGGQISGFIISIFLARLLSPEEFGLVGMSMVFIAILQIFKDVGFASALVQNENNTSLTYSSVFYLNIALGAILTILIYFAAPWIGKFYENKEVTELVRLFSVTFFISSFNIVQQTILRKDLNFKVLTIRSLIGQILAGIIAIYFAFQGFGVYALVIQRIFGSIITTAILWKVSNWYPKIEFSWLEVKKLTGFSAYVFFATSVNTLMKQADTLIIGKLFTPATLGFFSRANSLNSLINKNTVSSISKVFFPALATIKDDKKRFENAYIKTVNIVAGLSFFLTGAFFLVGEELIIGIYGSKWHSSVLIFQILIIKGFTYPINAIIVNSFLARGKSKENFHYGNIRKLIRLISFGVAFLYGFYPFLYALVIVSLINWIANNWFVSSSLKISFKKQLFAVLPYLFLSSVLVILLYYSFPTELSYGVAGLQFFLYSAAYLIILWVFKAELIIEGKYYVQLIWGKLRAGLNKA